MGGYTTPPDFQNSNFAPLKNISGRNPAMPGKQDYLRAIWEKIAPGHALGYVIAQGEPKCNSSF